MKKAASSIPSASSKDISRATSALGKSSITQLETIEDEPAIPEDPPFLLFSEWVDQEVQSEKWATKHTFEDPDGLIRLPPYFFLNNSTSVSVDTATGKSNNSSPATSSGPVTAPGSAEATAKANAVEYRRPVDFLGTEVPVMVQPMVVQEDLFRPQEPKDIFPKDVKEGGHTGRDSPGLPHGPQSARRQAGGSRGGANMGAIQEISATAGEEVSAPSNGGNATDGNALVLDEEVEVIEDVAEPTIVATEKPGTAPTSAEPARPNSQMTRDVNSAHSSSRETSALAKKTAAYTIPPKDVGWSTSSKYFQHNQALMGSSFFRHLLQYFHIAFEQGKVMKASPGLFDEFTPWEHIYPKGKDGLPVYNPSGKYMVRLYWLGAWRKVVIDDRIPVNAQGKPLLLSSPISNELWPLLLSKAILKLVMGRYRIVGFDYDLIGQLRLRGPCTRIR